MLALVLGGLFVTVLALWPALELKKRRKWNILMGILMLLAGAGMVGIAAWVASFASNLVSALVVGAIALVVLAGFGIGVIADLFPDRRIDYPWRVFALPPLIAIVFMTGATAVDFAKQQYGKNFDVLTSQVSTR